MVDEFSVDDILDEIMEGIRNPKPVTDLEVEHLNRQHGFSGQDAFELLRRYADIDARYGAVLSSDNDDIYTEFIRSDDYAWMEAFRRFEKSERWSAMLRQAIQERKEAHRDKEVNFGQQVRVIAEVDAIRSYVPAVDQIGMIVGGEYEYNQTHPERSRYMYKVQFPLPCRLVGNGMYVNDEIVTEDKADSYIKQHDLKYVVWQRDNLDYCIAYFAEDEIQIL